MIPSTGLLRSWSCPGRPVEPLRAQNMSGLGENLSGVRASSAVLSRSLSGSPASAVQNDARSSAVGLDSFGGMHKASAINDLFGAAQDEKKSKLLMAAFLKSSNAYACREITAFAKVYSQLIHQPNLSEEARTTLNTLAQQYTDKILKDGLGEKSAFGPWTAKTKEQYQKRSELEHKLATFANTYSAGDFLQLGSEFMAREVMPFIQTCIEQQLGETLSVTTLKRLHELVDKAAMKTFAALRQSGVELVEQRGVGVGKLARDLDTVATLPLLLRDILANLPKDLPEPAKPAPAPNTSATPDEVDPGRVPGPTLGPGQGGITINIGDIHIDKSQHIDNSDNSRHTNLRTEDRGERSTPTPLAQNLNLQGNLKVNSDTTSEATAWANGDKQYAGELLSSRSQVQEADVQTVAQTTGTQTTGTQTTGTQTTGTQTTGTQTTGTQTTGTQTTGTQTTGTQTTGTQTTGTQTTGTQTTGTQTTGTQTMGTQTSGSSANGLFNAARSVTDSLSHRQGIVDPRGMPQSDVSITDGGHSQRNGLTAIPAQEQQENERQMVVAEPQEAVEPDETDLQKTSRLTTFLSGPTLQQAVKTEPQEAVKPDASETEKPTVVDRHAKLKFREGNLYTLPTQAYLRSIGGHLKPEHELLKAVRGMLEADSNQPLSIRRDFDGLRNRLLPNYESDRIQLLQKFSNGSVDETVTNDLNTLCDLIAEHPGLDRRRPAIASFARTLIRECGLAKPGQQSNPLVVALLDSVAGTGDNKWNWRDEAQRKQPQSTASGVVLTTDGLHLDSLHTRQNYHAK